MNFYKAQDQARKQTSWLLFLYFLSVVSIVLITNVCVAIFVWYSNPSNLSNIHLQTEINFEAIFNWLRHIVVGLGWYKFLWVTGLVCGVIGMSMGFKWLSLRDGGRVVAESLGGRVLITNTDDALERRLLNVVEEIALAAGVPVPPVYLLDDEQGINAFAAGLSLEDAVIGITRGTLDCLNREQLQGVIAHEFSHILNGDMRLNMKLLAVLHGILMVSEAGRTMMRYSSRHSYSRSRKGANGGFLALGLCLYLIGCLGQFFGSVIKSAVSRQREFLADASAVQFTRNPEGIGGALKAIGGYASHSKITHNGAHELGHLFFSNAYKSFLSLFATHPSLEERINRILPSWNGRFTRVERQVLDSQMDNTYSSFVGPQKLSADVRGVSPAHEHELTGSSIPYDGKTAGLSSIDAHVTIKYSLQNKALAEKLFTEAKVLAHEPLGAVSLVLALLMDKDKAVRHKQINTINQTQSTWLVLIEKSKQLLNDIHAQGYQNNQGDLSLLEIAVPSLKLLSLKQYQHLRKLMSDMVNADGRIELFEWLVYQLVRQYCDRHFSLTKAQKAKYKTLNQVSGLYQTVLSRVVHYGGGTETEKKQAFRKACNITGIDAIELLPLTACSQTKFTRSVYELGRAYPLLKPRLMKGLISSAHFDGQVNDDERQVIRGIAAVMDCPLVGLELPSF